MIIGFRVQEYRGQDYLTFWAGEDDRLRDLFGHSDGRCWEGARSGWMDLRQNSPGDRYQDRGITVRIVSE
ncbi:uncharacterized protein BDW43DRAFT_293306 [Aspergillus alliaceus]|uniref:uncharacterized protein n=1 Tax=Petromyces alliaceus TaxID=209559 RepID=UPI0012A6AE4E|nr:uncharacterized protein BDW43DRAFT_293306 [Aspergillus alliaceus]KAB8227755.1 hypothetical protein BDW43DRAFT_293306 [Aspergillus alliaceus]